VCGDAMWGRQGWLWASKTNSDDQNYVWAGGRVCGGCHVGHEDQQDHKDHVTRVHRVASVGRRFPPDLLELI
jgi:hypothetical protein